MPHRHSGRNTTFCAGKQQMSGASFACRLSHRTAHKLSWQHWRTCAYDAARDGEHFQEDPSAQRHGDERQHGPCVAQGSLLAMDWPPLTHAQSAAACVQPRMGAQTCLGARGH